MSNDDSQTTPPPAARSGSNSLLLPSSSNLLPSSGSAKLLGKGEDDQVAEDLARVGTAAKELVSRATELAVENAPELKKKLQETGSLVGELAVKTLKAGSATARSATGLAAESVQAARENLGDPEKRRSALAANRKKLLGGVAAAGILLGGGWVFANHQASVTAKQQVDDFLARQKLHSMVSYDQVKSSAFSGEISINGITLRLPTAPTDPLDALGQVLSMAGQAANGLPITEPPPPPMTPPIPVGSIIISDIVHKDGVFHGIHIAAIGARLPLLDLLRQDGNILNLIGMIEKNWIRDLLGMGYTTPDTNLSLALRFDPDQSTLDYEKSVTIDDLGAWKTKLTLGGVDPSIITFMNNLAQSRDEQELNRNLAAARMVMPSLARATLMSASLELDNSGYVKRAQTIPDTELPATEDQVIFGTKRAKQEELTKLGMSPTEAEEAKEAINTWLTQGGTIRLATNLSQPLPLFAGGNIYQPEITGLDDFMRLTHSKITN